MFPISSSSFSFCFISRNRLWLTFVNGFLFHCCQFSSNLLQYSRSYWHSPHPSSNFAVYLPCNSLLNMFLSFSLSCHLVSFSSSLLYSLSNSSTKSFVFLRFFLPSQVSSSAIYPFHHTKYFSLPCTHFLFSIFSTSYFSSLLIITGYGFSFLYPSTCPVYLCTLLTLTTRCIFTVLGSSSSMVFVKTIDLTL